MKSAFCFGIVALTVLAVGCGADYKPVDPERVGSSLPPEAGDGGPSGEAGAPEASEAPDGPHTTMDAEVAPVSMCQEGAACAPTGPCTEGKTTCSSDGGAVCQQTPLVDGTACAHAEQPGLCKAGVCLNSKCGTDCEPTGCPAQAAGVSCPEPLATAACAQRKWNCSVDQWNPKCEATVTALADKTSCGPGQICFAKRCTPSTCQPGVACGDAMCWPGKIACPAPNVGLCELADADKKVNGTACGPGKVCREGACVACEGQGGTCRAGCRIGTTACTLQSGGALACVPGAPVVNGSACDPQESGKFCRNGACETCDKEGMPCRLGCRTGTYQCPLGGASTCLVTADVPNGTACGTNLVCSEGECQAACPLAGMACTPSTCKVGMYQCVANVQTCVAMSDAPNGTACMGGAGMCTNGMCSGNCPRAGQSCDIPDSPCVQGRIACMGNTTEQCVAAGNKPGGTVCPTGTCNATGVCSCPVGSSCTPAGDNPCRTGRVVRCEGNTQICESSGMQPDRSSCGASKACSGGACVTCNTADFCGTSCAKCTTTMANGVAACEGGRCVAKCKEGFYKCGDRCVAAAEVAPCTCGACAPAGSHQSECSAGPTQCGSVCAPGWHRCGDGACYSDTDKSKCGPGCGGCPAWNESCVANQCIAT